MRFLIRTKIAVSNNKLIKVVSSAIEQISLYANGYHTSKMEFLSF